MWNFYMVQKLEANLKLANVIFDLWNSVTRPHSWDFQDAISIYWAAREVSVFPTLQVELFEIATTKPLWLIKKKKSKLIDES